jgi:hypothetical protein
MANQRLGLGSRGISLLGGIVVGDPAGSGVGTAVKRMVTGTFTVDTSSVALSAVETGTFTLTGATTGDMVFVFPSTALNAGLTLMAAANVTATSTVTVAFVNETTAAIVQTSGLTNRYLFWDIT